MTFKNWPLYLILFATLGPAVLALVLFQHNENLTTQSLIDQGKQGGDFLQFPIRIADTSSFNHQQWHLIKVAESCDQDCQQQMSRLYAIHTALGKRRDKADVLIRQPNDFSLDSHSKSAEKILEKYSAFIATPGGEVILAYKSGQLDKTLLKDLTHLIKMNPIITLSKQE